MLNDESDVRHVTISQEGGIQAAKKELERLPETMYMAEVARNSMQAYIASGLTGPVTWFYTRDDGTADRYIPGFYDTACGMSLDELINHLAQLRNSGGHIEGKHGIGARLAALRLSPKGVEWWSLKDGKVNGLRMWIDEHGRIVYRIFENYEPDILHPDIIAAGHGTQVLFVGMEPLPAKDMPSESVAKWLSTRWFRHKPDIKLYVMRSRQGDNEAGVFVAIPSQEEALDALCEFKCDVQLSDAWVRTYVLKPNLENVPQGERYHYSDLYRTKDGGGEKAKPRPKFYIVYEDEIYESTEPKGVPGRLRNFGITHGHQQVVMLMFPSPEHYGPNDMRTRIELLRKQDISDVELPFKRWAKEFNELMPDELRTYVEKSAIGSEEQNMQIISEIMEEHLKYLVGPDQRKNVQRGDGDAEINPPKPNPPPDEDEDEDIPPEPEPEPEPDPEPIKRRRRKKAFGRPELTDRKTGKLKLPKVVWTEPDPSDALYNESGQYLPHANRGAGELHLNRNWICLRKWQERMAASATPELSSTMVKHYTEMATALIHVDTIVRNKFGSLPDPGADDFRQAMLLPACRDMTFREVRKKSGQVRNCGNDSTEETEAA